MKTKTKFTAISDIHGTFPLLSKTDILLIAGDICPVNQSHNPKNQETWIINKFLPWVKDQANQIIFIAGNHDFYFQKLFHNITEDDLKTILPKNVHYLRDSMVEINGIKIYGTPWTPTFGRWAFMVSEEFLENIFTGIPDNIDILLSHGPAYKFNDIILKGPYQNSIRQDNNLGSKALRKHLLRSKPKYFCYGHIHECSHIPLIIPQLTEDLQKNGETISNCVSLLNDDYNLEYLPYEFIIEKEDKL